MIEATDALRAALAEPDRQALQAEGKHPAPWARHCEAKAFEIEIRMLKAALAEPEQEPVAWRVKWPAFGGGYRWLMVDSPLMEKEGFVNEPLYTAPPQRKPLTINEVEQILAQHNY